MKEWFQQFNQREQVWLLAGGAALGLYLLFVAIWRPVVGMRDDMILRNQATQASLSRIQTMAAELQQLQGQGGGANAQRNLNQMINNSTAEFALQPSRIQPNSKGEMQIRFEDARLSDLLRWLHQIEVVDGLLIVDASIMQGERGGVVNANIRLGQGA